jgi:hypothetical protein
LKKTIFISGICFALASLGLQRVAAQNVPAAQQSPDETKVIRIYRGTGRFDLATAEKLRPNLAKAFPPGKSPALQAAAIATGSSAPNPEISKKITKSNDL